MIVTSSETLSSCYRRQNENGVEWLRNNSNTKIRDRQTPEQKFGWRMKGRLFMKSIKYQSIAQQCSDGQKNVQSWKKYSCSCKYWRFGCNVQLDCSVQFGYSEVGHSCSPASLGYGKRVYAQRTFIMCCTLADETFPLRATWLRVFEWTPLRWQQRKNGCRKN